ncbi:MAG: hypothetical protein QNJ03_08835 [Dinoroseobacter sp.]|nr:hypothetical protein [Dinoroseobacter sp.]
MFSKVLAALSACACLASAGQAASIDIDIYGSGKLQDFQERFGAELENGSFVGEDFENLGADQGEGVVDNHLTTKAGIFSQLGGFGSGGTVRQLGLTSSSKLALRDNKVYGRQNTWPEGGNWFLDSNDTYGFVWKITEAHVGGAFDKLIFALTDGSDGGAYLRIELDDADNTTREQRETGKGKLGDGNITFVSVDFGRAVSAATVTIGNFTSNANDANWKRNEGVGIDGAYVNVVPLPPSLAFLLASVGAFGFARKRKP